MESREKPARATDATSGEEPNGSIASRLQDIQIVLAADGVRDIALSSPVWASIIAVLFGGFVPQLGQRPVDEVWPWIALCAVIGIAIFGMWRVIKNRTRLNEENGALQLTAVVAGYLATGAAWSLIVPIYWQAENALNHCFLLVLIMGSVSLFLNSKSGRFETIVAATLPNLLMIWIHFAGAPAAFDVAMTILVPVWAAQLYIDAWRGCRAITDAHRTKLGMERLAEDLAAARDQAFEANRAKSTFLANMSHELRTPLNAIMAFSEVIATEALGRNERERYRDYAKDVLASGHHLLGLVNDLLDLSKIESGKLAIDPVWLDGRAVLRECSAIVTESARKKGLDLGVTCTPEPLKVFADERGIKQIVLNLLSNGVKHTPPGGFVRASLTADESGTTLCVEDNGKGIPADQLQRIQQPFEQLDNRYGIANGGSGLGLALSRALAEMHGGSFDIESTVGKGTRVRVRFPKREEARDHIADGSESVAA